MSPDSLIDRLSPFDRVLLLLAIVWCVAGTVGNHARIRDGETSQFWALFAVAQWAAIAWVIAYSLVRRQRRLADYGFSLRRGGLISLAAVALLHVYLAIRYKLELSTGASFLPITVGAFMEEIAFRAIAIDNFVRLLDGVKGKAFWAILASSALFSIPHIVTKTSVELRGLFLSSLIVGWVYYKSKSIVLPAWYHCLSSAGSAGGIFAICLYGVLSLTSRYKMRA